MTDASGRIPRAAAGRVGDVDALRRAAETTALSVYELVFLDGGGYRCTSFLGEGVARLLGGLPAGLDDEEAYERAVHPEDRVAYDRVIDALQRGEPTELEYRLVGYDGKTRWVWERCVPRTAADGKAIVHGVAIDVTNRRELAERLAETQARLEHLAYHDPLTGLANRLHFHEQLAKALLGAREHGGEVGVLFVDLDGFKRVNDEWGHAVGDELLCHVAHRLAAVTRKPDLVARLGGDEFLALVDCSHPHAAEAHRLASDVADRIIRALSEPFALTGATIELSASVGIATYPDDATSPTDLIHRADQTMYVAKHGKPGANASRAA